LLPATDWASAAAGDIAIDTASKYPTRRSDATGRNSPRLRMS
jgi:hypothetical protein